MGCDIHLVVESKYYDSWLTALADVWTPRNYVLFGNMAEGVRYDSDNHFPLRGFPEDADYSTKEKYYIALSELSEEDVERYSTSYGCKIIEQFDKPYYIENPDWHSASWLTPEEFEHAIDNTDNYLDEYGTYEAPKEYRAILAYMKALDVPSRIVFWFDN